MQDQQFLKAIGVCLGDEPVWTVPVPQSGVEDELRRQLQIMRDSRDYWQCQALDKDLALCDQDGIVEGYIKQSELSSLKERYVVRGVLLEKATDSASLYRVGFYACALGALALALRLYFEGR